MVRAISTISSKGMLPECAMFFCFLRSRGGSVRAQARQSPDPSEPMSSRNSPLSARMTSELAAGTIVTAA
jgi:hypothetical protein